MTIRTIGLAAPVGLTIEALSAAVRAGVARLFESAHYGRRGAPLVLARVPEHALAPAGVSDTRADRIARLAGPALRRCARSDLGVPPVLLSLPEPLPGVAPIDAHAVLASLQDQLPNGVDWGRSKTFPGGRAGLGEALLHADGLLRAGHPTVIVGGADTHDDPELLAWLDGGGRVRGEGVFDGFTPGEGSCFLEVTRSVGPGEGYAQITSVAVGAEPGHRYSSEVHRGDGLARTIAEALEGLGPPPVGRIYAGLNGEHLQAKEMGVALLRSRGGLAPAVEVEHPADCVGDLGAAMMPMWTALAAAELAAGRVEAPCLVWCASDLESRAALVVAKSGA